MAPDSPIVPALLRLGLPTMLVLNREGKVVWSHIGALSSARESDLRGVLDAALR